MTQIASCEGLLPQPGLVPFVAVVDDDEGLREALGSLVRSVGFDTKLFGSAVDFVAEDLPEAPGCIILDVRLPGLSGLDFQDELARRGVSRPVIFMSGHGDIPMSVRAMKAGAVDFLPKPFRDQDMLDAVTVAIALDARRQSEESAHDEVKSLYEALTPREREIMDQVTTGLMNKQVAANLGLSEITVKIHRGNVMRKMKAKSIAGLVRLSAALGRSSRT